MTKAILRWIIPLVALLVLGPIAGLLTITLRAPDGGPDTTLLLCTTPIMGVLAGLGAFALAAVAGCIASRLLGSGYGLFAAGLVLTWAAWGIGRIDQILRRTESASTFWMIAAEGLFVGILALLTGALILAVAREPAPTHGPHVGAPQLPASTGVGFFLSLVELLMLGIGHISGGNRRDRDEDGAFSPIALLALLFAVVAGAAGAWLIARDSHKGQTYAAAVIAAILAAGMGRAAAQRAPATLFILAMAILAVLGPALAMLINLVPTSVAGGGQLTFLPTSAQVVAAARAGILLPLARPLPLDWLAGAFVGIPIGASWAAAMLDRHVPAPQAA